MITTIWYHGGDKNPDKDGYYLAYKMSSLGDDSEGYGVHYWDNHNRHWRETGARHSSNIRVSIWADPPEHDPDYSNYSYSVPTVAEIDAWKNVKEAIDQFNMIKELVK